MNDDLIQLQSRVDMLETFVRSLGNSSTIPLEVDQAYRRRFGAFYELGTFTQANLQRSISITGNPQTIQVLEYPDSFLHTSFKGLNYKVPIFNDS